jgi:hypothetical protein
MSAIEQIHEKTDFVKTAAGISLPYEFIDGSGVAVKPGIPYHIHYTKDKKEYYMTGAVHSSKSELIFKLIPNTNFAKYKKSKKNKLRREVYIDPYVLRITKEDYKKGKVIRYFARQGNDENGEVFEVSSNDFGLEVPFYKTVSLDWMLVGPYNVVKKHNEGQIGRASRVLPRISKILNPIQFLKPAKESKEYIFSQLQKEYKVSIGTTETTTTNTSGGSDGY